MSTPAILSESPLSNELGIAADLARSEPLSGQVATRILSGTSTLGASLAIEKGFGFLANILAARFAGAATFGAYSLAVGTANTISTYAAGNIGSTAARFSGKYPFGTSSYSTLVRALAIVSVASAAIAAGSLWVGAAPIAALLHKPGMTGLLRWAAISAVGIILLECARGFFVGQRRLLALLTLSLVVGAGMLAFVPAAASMHRPVRMVLSQGAVSLGAVAICIAFSRLLRLKSIPAATKALPTGPVLKEVWSFGLIQLAGLAGANLSGWWLTALVARADSTLVQMSFFTIASQLRNLTGLVPGLLTEGSYAVMADPAGEHRRTPHQVMALCTFATTSCTVLLAGCGMILAPWLLSRLYGASYQGAASAVAMALAVAVAHMGNAPVIARLSIVSVRSVGFINAVWAVLVALSATTLLFRSGGAAFAMCIFFVAHVCSAGLSLIVLSRKEQLPTGMAALFLISIVAVTALACQFWLRHHRSDHAQLISAVMIATTTVAMIAMYGLGKRNGWLPTKAGIQQLAKNIPVLRSVTWKQAHGA